MRGDLAAQPLPFDLVVDPEDGGRVVYAWEYDGPVKQERPGVWARSQPSLARVLTARIRPRSRESRPRGRRTRSPAISRDGPLPPAEDPDDLDPSTPAEARA
jgi:hypothetical protein